VVGEKRVEKQYARGKTLVRQLARGICTKGTALNTCRCRHDEGHHHTTTESQ
jgi:hypothetical protein